MSEYIPLAEYKRNHRAVDHALVARREADLTVPEFCDEAMALEFAERVAGRLRYVALWGRWMEWSGTHWRTDETKATLDLVRETCRRAAERAMCPADHQSFTEAPAMKAHSIAWPPSAVSRLPATLPTSIA